MKSGTANGRGDLAAALEGGRVCAGPGKGLSPPWRPVRQGGRAARPQGAVAWAVLAGWVAWDLAGLPIQASAPPPSATSTADLPGRLPLIEAVRSTLQRDPGIQVQEQQVALTRGAAQSAAGQFDPVLDTALSAGHSRTPLSNSQRIQDGLRTGIEALKQDTVSYRVGLNKQFRSGITAGPAVELSRVADNANQEVAANVAQAVLVINVPLLRGLGRSAVEAPERAARFNAEGADLDLRQITATRVFNTVAAYWNCRAAEQQLLVLRESARRTESLLTNLTELVRTGEFPAADLDQARADLAEKEADVRAGEQNLYDARQALGLALGLESSQLDSTPLPAEDFPKPPAEGWPQAVPNDALIQRCLTRRPDYQSARKAELASEALVVGARNNVKPQLDLNLQAGYTGLDEGNESWRFLTAADPWATPGANVLGTLRLTFPIRNRAARGLLAQRVAARAQAALRSSDLERTITSAVRSSLAQLESAVVEWRRLESSFQSYQKAVASEAEKMTLGNSTVLDQITIADRWTNMRLKHVEVKARYAIAVVRVRYESGWLVPAQTPLPARILATDLITPPAFTRSDSPGPSTP